MTDRAEVYGRGNLRWICLGPGTCKAQLIVDVPRSNDGKRQRRKFTLTGSKRDIERERIRILQQLHEGKVRVQTPLTVAEFMAYWAEHALRPTSAMNTVQRAGQYAQFYINPAIGSAKLRDLSPAQVQGLYASLRTSGRRRTLKGKPAGLAETTINGIHRVLSQALDMAVTWQFIPENPCKHVAVPKPRKRKPIILSREQVATVLQHATHPQLRTYIMIAICCGTRRGEGLGLKWADLDLAKGTIALQHNLVEIDNELMVKEPKTEHGKRAIKMPAILVEYLLEEKRLQEERRRVLGSAYWPDDFVICWEDGRPVNPRTFYRPLKRLLARLGLPQDVKLHDLRHAHSTHLLGDNVHPRVVADRLGHSEVETTMTIYSHVLPHIQQEAADATDRGLREALGPGWPAGRPIPNIEKDGTKMAPSGEKRTRTPSDAGENGEINR